MAQTEAKTRRVAPGYVPLAVKLAYTAFMAVLVPVYWYWYGPTNFLYFCDMCLFLTLIGIWLPSPLLVSMCAVGILVPQIYWNVDFAANAAGVHLAGMTDYMFISDHSLFLRALSGFHGWLPLLLLYLVWRLGFDRRAFVAWTALAYTLILVCFFLMPPPDPNAGLTPVNINYVFGPSDAEAQHWVPAWAWVLSLAAGLTLIAYLPVQFLLARSAPAPKGR